VGTLFLLTFIGFAIYGPQVLLVGTAPADLARRGTAAAAAGFVNFMGYMGAFSGDTVTGWLTKYYDWPAAIKFWAGCAFGAAVAVAFLWNATANYSDHDSDPPEEE
jgi:OPA family glycerol-3-phosphate transporter-like MFS transporter